MSNEEVVGRIAALEVIAMTALGLCLAKNRNDTDHRKSSALLACMRDALKTQAGTLPAEAQRHATGYGNHLLDAVAENLQVLRGQGDQLN
jgi:hypothetical protein